MKILMLPTLNAPVVFYRMENFVKHLRRLDHEVAFTYWGPDFQLTCFWEKDMNEEFISEINGLSHNTDITIFQSIHTQKAMSLILALQEAYRKPILAEYDDDIHTVNSATPSFVHTGPGTNVELWGDEQIKKSDGVIVSTDYLKKIYSEKNAKVFTMPNSIDFEIWDHLKPPPAKEKHIKIGWEGGAGHITNLRLVKNVVKRILDEFPNVVFHFKYGGYPVDFLKNNGRCIFEDYHTWTAVNEFPQILKNANFDIGLAPLRDFNFNRSKSNLRWLEYSALKIPTVASFVEPYKCIKEGETGFLVKEEDDWIEALRKLIKDEELRKHIGQSAYDYIKNNYNVEDTAKRYIKCLEKFI